MAGLLVAAQETASAPAFMAARADASSDRPRIPAQMTAAVAASPAPVVFTISAGSQGTRSSSRASAAMTPPAPRLTNTRPTPASTSALAASAGSCRPVRAAASISLGLKAVRWDSTGFSRPALVTDTGSA